LHCGIISTGILSSLKQKISLVGDTINVAARLCFLAENNNLLISENYYENIENKHNFAPKIINVFYIPY